MWTDQCDVNSGLRENSKEPSSSTISTEALLNDDSNEENFNINYVSQQLCKTNGKSIIFLPNPTEIAAENIGKSLYY